MMICIIVCCPLRGLHKILALKGFLQANYDQEWVSDAREFRLPAANNGNNVKRDRHLVTACVNSQGLDLAQG